MSAQPDRPVPAGSSTAMAVLADERARALATATAAPASHATGWSMRRAGTLLGARAPIRLPVSSALVAIVAVVVYGLVTVAAGGLLSVGLACIPLFVAAAVLPIRGAGLVAALTVIVTLLPSVVTRTWVVADLVMLTELTILLVASVALRLIITRLTLTRAVEAEADARLQERINTVLAIAERLTRTFDREEILATVVAETHRVLGTDGVTIRIVRDGILGLAAYAGLYDTTAERLPTFRTDEGWFREVFRTGLPWACDDVATLVGEDLAMVARYAVPDRFRADLVVPLIGHERVIGAISAVMNEPHHWSPADIEFVRALATHAAIAIGNADLFEQAATRAGHMSVLQAASARMSRQNSVESVGRVVVEETRRIIDYHNARVYVLEGDRLMPIAFEGIVGAYEKVDMSVLETRLGEGFTGWAAANGTPLLIPDANADPRGATIPGTDEVDESMLVVPMRYDERVIGAITLSKLGLHQFRDEDLNLLTILADQAATALESVRLLARAQGLAGELRRLLDMNGELAHSLDPLKVADLLAQHLAGAMGMDVCAISYWDRAGDSLLTWGFFPEERPEKLLAEYPLADFPASRRVLIEKVTIVVDVNDPASDPAEADLLREYGRSLMVMLPLVAKGESIGLVELIASSSVAVDPARLELARSMANEAAMALENAKLYEDVRKLADHDQLTGFYNHRYLHERLGEEIVRAQRSRTPLSLLMIDLDDFKLVNDTFGHLFGDRVLVWSAELIRSSLRASDVPARYGGDEFAVILPDTDAAAASAVAERMLAAFRDRAFASETRGPVPVAASIGEATFPSDGRTGQDLIAAADRAMYRAKGAGGHGAARAGGRATLRAGHVDRAHVPPADARPRPTPRPRRHATIEPATAEIVPGQG